MGNSVVDRVTTSLVELNYLFQLQNSKRSTMWIRLIIPLAALLMSGCSVSNLPTRVPPSNQLDQTTLAVMAQMDREKAPGDIAGRIGAQRAFYGAWNDRRLGEMRQVFNTTERRTMIGGVAVDIVEPSGGIAPRNENRVLINVHGGAFMWGAGSGALVESIPIAATMGIRVVAVDYRLAPENRYPAVSEDVTAVYSALLEDYPAANIGIYGCSAGGIATAQSVAWMARQGFPRPGAIGTFCGTGAPYSGDSRRLDALFESGAMANQAELPRTLTNSYMETVPASDCAAYPLTCEGDIAKMPPTLLLAGSRDFAASALTLAHRRLAAAGVSSRLFLFDGLPHAFFMWPQIPESREVYRIVAEFFDQELGTEVKQEP